MCGRLRSRGFVCCDGAGWLGGLVRAGIRVSGKVKVRARFKQPLYVFMCAVCSDGGRGAREVGTGTICRGMHRKKCETAEATKIFFDSPRPKNI